MILQVTVLEMRVQFFLKFSVSFILQKFLALSWTVRVSVRSCIKTLALWANVYTTTCRLNSQATLLDLSNIQSDQTLKALSFNVEKLIHITNLEPLITSKLSSNFNTNAIKTADE